MESKKGFGKQVREIIEGHGFYIVMALCAAIIGVSIWSLLRSPAPVPDEAEFDDVLSEVEPMPYDVVAPEITELDSQIENETDTDPEESDKAAETVSEESYVWPLEGSIQREYSMDRLQYDITMADWRTHDGVDLQAPIGANVAAIHSGIVLNAFSDDSYGQTVVIDHGNGLICAYSNLSHETKVTTGDIVEAGDIIGTVGESCGSEAGQESHLHFSAKLNGETISPLEYLPQKG